MVFMYMCYVCLHGPTRSFGGTGRLMVGPVTTQSFDPSQLICLRGEFPQN